MMTLVGPSNGAKCRVFFWIEHFLLFFKNPMHTTSFIIFSGHPRQAGGMIEGTIKNLTSPASEICWILASKRLSWQLTVIPFFSLCRSYSLVLSAKISLSLCFWGGERLWKGSSLARAHLAAFILFCFFRNRHCGLACPLALRCRRGDGWGWYYLWFQVPCHLVGAPLGWLRGIVPVKLMWWDWWGSHLILLLSAVTGTE